MPPMRVTSPPAPNVYRQPCYAPPPMASTLGTPAFPSLRERPAAPDLTSIDPRLDLEAEIRRLKDERNAVLLAHYYQESEIQDLADFVGDSLQLAQAAQKTKADVIALRRRPLHGRDREDPEPDREGRGARPRGRLLARRLLPARRLPRVARRRIPGAVVGQLHQLLGRGEGALRLHLHVLERREDRPRRSRPTRRSSSRPTRTSARWLAKKTGRPMVLWQGTCIVHETFSERELVAAQGAATRTPAHRAHPECEEAILAHADYVGSTTVAPRSTSRTSAGRSSSSRPRRGSSTRWRRPRPARSSSRRPAGRRLRVQRVPVHEAATRSRSSTSACATCGPRSTLPEESAARPRSRCCGCSNCPDARCGLAASVHRDRDRPALALLEQQQQRDADEEEDADHPEGVHVGEQEASAAPPRLRARRRPAAAPA